MKYFLDWGRTKQVAVVDENGEEREVIPKNLAFEIGDEVYLEAGFSSRIIYQLLDEGCAVYRIDASVANGMRTESKKSDMEDAHFIRQLYLSNPDTFSALERPSDEDINLRRLYTMYRQVTRDIVRMKNIKSSLKWEYGMAGYDAAIKSLEQSKREIFSQMRPLIKEDLKRFREIKGTKGIGPMLLAQLLAVAHPKNFPSLSKFLSYCGCKASTFWKTFEDGEGKGRGRHNWDAKIIGYLLASSVLKQQDPCLKEWYYDIKEQFQTDHPDWSKGKCHGKAMNRLRTFLMKEIYHCLKNNESQPWEVAA